MLKGRFAAFMLLALLPATAFPQSPTITNWVYDEDLSVDRPVLVKGTAYPARVGVSKYAGISATSTAHVIGGVLKYGNATGCKLYDARAATPKQAGRCHYVKLRFLPGSKDVRALNILAFVGEPGSPNAWNKTTGDPGLIMKTAGTPEVGGCLRNTGFNFDRGDYSTQGNFQIFGAAIKIHPTLPTTWEFMLVERPDPCGAFCYYRQAGVEAPWSMVYLTGMASGVSGKIMTANLNCNGFDGILRLATADVEGWEPTPLVQQSFSTAVSPSDGLGQTESGGDLIAAEGSGELIISGGKLESVSGDGMAVFESGESDVAIYAHVTPYDDSPAGIVIRAVDEDNYLAAKIDSLANILNIVEVVGGAETIIATRNLNALPDFYDLPSGYEVRMQVHSEGEWVRVSCADLDQHISYVDVITGRFATATKHGVWLKNGGTPSTATRLAVYPQHAELPDFGSP